MKFLVPEAELRTQFSHSGGPGGQNINKRMTRVTVSWDYWSSMSLDQLQKERIARALKNRINKNGLLYVVCQETRFQETNYQLAVDILNKLVSLAIKPKKERKTTKPTKASIEKRINLKKIRSKIKEQRKKPEEE